MPDRLDHVVDVDQRLAEIKGFGSRRRSLFRWLKRLSQSAPIDMTKLLGLSVIVASIAILEIGSLRKSS